MYHTVISEHIRGNPDVRVETILYMKETRRATVEGEDGDVKHLFDVPRCLRLRLAEGEERPEHSHPGNEILLFVHEGVLEMRLDGEPHLVEEGEAIRFSGEREISPHAVEDTVAVLVFVETDAP